jgi:hypothetical protein
MRIRNACVAQAPAIAVQEWQCTVGETGEALAQQGFVPAAVQKCDALLIQRVILPSRTPTAFRYTSCMCRRSARLSGQLGTASKWAFQVGR